MRRDPGQWMTLILGGACGLFALVALLQTLGIGSGYHLLEGDEAKLDQDLMQPMQQIEFKLPDFTSYVEIAQRPLFNNDRKPRAIDETAGAVATDAPPPVGRSSPSRIFMSVDLPAPLAPTRPVTPPPISRSRVSRARTEP